MLKKSVAKPRSSPAQPAVRKAPETPRTFTGEFRREAVAMLLDSHSPGSVAERLGITTNMLYRWKSAPLKESGPMAESLEQRVHELEAALARVVRERDILKEPWSFSAAASGRRLRGYRGDLAAGGATGHLGV